MKAIKQAQTRDILDAYNREDISYSRMNEMFNELADDFAIGFAEWIEEYQGGTPNLKILKELLEKYKTEKGL